MLVDVLEIKKQSISRIADNLCQLFTQDEFRNKIVPNNDELCMAVGQYETCLVSHIQPKTLTEVKRTSKCRPLQGSEILKNTN